jgi:hypothetical protein
LVVSQRGEDASSRMSALAAAIGDSNIADSKYFLARLCMLNSHYQISKIA